MLSCLNLDRPCNRQKPAHLLAKQFDIDGMIKKTTNKISQPRTPCSEAEKRPPEEGLNRFVAQLNEDGFVGSKLERERNYLSLLTWPKLRPGEVNNWMSFEKKGNNLEVFSVGTVTTAHEATTLLEVLAKGPSFVHAMKRYRTSQHQPYFAILRGGDESDGKTAMVRLPVREQRKLVEAPVDSIVKLIAIRQPKKFGNPVSIQPTLLESSGAFLQVTAVKDKGARIEVTGTKVPA